MQQRDLTLSVILVAYNMQRAAPRSVQSLLTPYQRGISADSYEVIVVDNGSDSPLTSLPGPEGCAGIRTIRLENAPASPARAINLGLAKARGQVVAVMVDGAHMLTPGALRHGLDLFGSLDNPVVALPQFFLGPGPQTETIYQGYDEAAEDALLEQIGWPEDGYRLFEIGVPYRIEPGGRRPQLFWFVRLFESNCLFARRETLEHIGGCDERFDLPGGGLLLPDLYRRLADLPDAELVQLLGEASFHQIHGGTSTNVTRAQQKARLQEYLAQYQAIRGRAFEVSQKPLRYYGHMPTPQARRLMLTG
jgi:glycosyltransferase involved in cell wall biosynthesis